MNSRLKGRDFISLKNYSKEDLETILHLAFDQKRKVLIGEPHHLLTNKELGMLFFNPSTRTRISFETAMSRLGGHAQFYAPEHLHAFFRESWADTAQVMSRYLDGIVIRLYRIPGQNLKYGDARKIVNTLAENASIPIINASDDQEHPCQVMADIMTLIEKFGPDYKNKKVAVVWVRHPRVLTPGILHSLSIAGGTLGMNLTFAYPDGLELDPEYINEGMRRCEQSGGNIEIMHNLSDAVKNADVIYTKSWGSITKTEEENAQMLETFTDWFVTKEHFDLAAPGAIFMDAMPIARGIDATDEVIDGPMSVMYDQAENRLHAEKAILSLVM